MVGTPRCGVPARQGGTKGFEHPRFCAVPLPSPDASLGDADGAARCPYLKKSASICEICGLKCFSAGRGEARKEPCAFAAVRETGFPAMEGFIGANSRSLPRAFLAAQLLFAIGVSKRILKS
jgi:hypothetical protein